MKKVSMDGKGTFEIGKVRKASEAGAIDKLWVSDKILREERKDVRPLMEKLGIKEEK